VAKDSTADFLLFTSDALEPFAGEWLDELLQPFTDPTAGLVSGTTYCATSRFEHAGYYLHGSFLDKAYYRVKRSERGQRAVLETIRELSAVDWQCLMVRRDVFERVGGFDMSLAHPWCVVDLCLRVAGLGYRTVITPRAEFWEFSNDDDLAWYRQRAPKAFREKWADAFANDPYRPKPPRRMSHESERPFWRPQRLRDYRSTRSGQADV
jgi:GT2 family glycosyltransferase